MEVARYKTINTMSGLNAKIPFSEVDKVDTPVSLYAATKKSNELMAYTYTHLYKFATTGLRFFTVYYRTGTFKLGKCTKLFSARCNRAQILFFVASEQTSRKNTGTAAFGKSVFFVKPALPVQRNGNIRYRFINRVLRRG